MKCNTFIRVGAMAAILAAPVISMADELTLTAEQSKAGGLTMIAVDVVSDGVARGVQARIGLPKGVKVDTSKCLSKAPAGFQGVCEFNQGEVRLMLFAFDQRALPSGLVELGELKVSGQIQGQSAVKVVDFQIVDAQGASVPVKSSVSLGTDPGSRPDTNAR